MSKYVEILARVPLPDDMMDAHPIQTRVLEIGKEFRDSLTAYVDEAGIKGVEIKAKLGTAKGTSGRKRKGKSTPPATAAA